MATKQSYNYPAAIVAAPLSGLDVNVHDAAGNPISSTAGALNVSATVNSGPIEFNLNTTPTVVAQDTVTPANNRPLPVNLINATGERGTNAQPLRIDPTGTTTQPVSALALPLPAGAATETTLSAINTKVPANLTVTATRLLVDGSGVTQPISAAALPLPTGAATAAKQPALGTAGTASADVITVQGTASMTALTVNGSGFTQPVSLAAGPQGRTAQSKAIIDYSTTSITTSAYVQVIASVGASQVNMVEIFHSSGTPLLLATGGSGSEVDQIYVIPGGNGQLPLRIAATTRVSIKAVGATVNSGNFIVNFYT